MDHTFISGSIAVMIVYVSVVVIKEMRVRIQPGAWVASVRVVDTILWHYCMDIVLLLRYYIDLAPSPLYCWILPFLIIIRSVENERCVA